MSESPRPAGRSFPVGLLILVLLVPVGLLAGRLIAALPVPEPKPAAGTAVAPGAAPRPEAESPPARHAQPPRSGSLHWMSMNAAMEEARASGKPVMIDFSAEWCPPCQRLKREVFDDPGRARAVEDLVVPVAIVDRYRETGSNPAEVEDLQRRFGIQGFPTLVVLSPATGRHVQTAGYGGPDYTLQWLANAARQVK